jgi:hypothetical protein
MDMDMDTGTRNRLGIRSLRRPHWTGMQFHFCSFLPPPVLCVACSQPQLSHSHQAQPNYFGFLTYAIAEVVGFNAQLP